MTSFDRQRGQNINNTFSSVVSFLNNRLEKTSVELRDTRCYYHRGTKSKLEVVVFANPGIAAVDIRLSGLRDAARDPYYVHSYDIKSLSLPAFKREIEDMIYKCDRPRK